MKIWISENLPHSILTSLLEIGQTEIYKDNLEISSNDFIIRKLDSLDEPIPYPGQSIIIYPGNSPVDRLKLREKVYRILPLDYSIEEIIFECKEIIKGKNRTSKIQKDNSILVRYFSEDMLMNILSSDNATNVGGENRTVSILFFDLRQSTKIAESLPPNIFANLLSEIFTDIMDLIYGNMGSVNKLLGDGMLATFGAPITRDNDVVNACLTAIQIREYLNTFNDVRPDYLKEPIRAGMGISTGKVFTGNVGSVRRIEYTVLGDPVNVASRLENLTKEVGKSILVDENTKILVEDVFTFSELPETLIRGKENVIKIYSLEEKI